MPTLAEKLKQMNITVIDGKVIPRNVVVETIFGCNASCIMCPIELPTRRKKGAMTHEIYVKVVDALAPYASVIKQIDLFGIGEPLLDKEIHRKIAYAKQKGFTDVGFATNADLLSPEVARRVFDAGLDTIIISLDGVTKEVHESIRRKTDFANIVENVKAALALRDQRGYKTKFVMRFVRQAINRSEWGPYRSYWTPLLSKDRGDLIIGYDMHSWGGEIDLRGQGRVAAIAADVPCHHLFDRLIILNDGTVPLCCADMHLANHVLGNVKDQSPIEIFNGSVMKKIREQHLSGQRLSVGVCAACTILESESVKDIE